MSEENLTKEERKAIKNGRAYKIWKIRILITIGVSLLWGFCGIPLVSINRVIETVYIIGLLLCVIAEFYTIILTSWKCSDCKGKLPSKSAIGGSATVLLPVLARKCPHCGADLMQ